MTTISPENSQSYTILLIDDFQSSADLVRLILSRRYNDSTIIIATSGTEGIKTAQKSSPDLIILRIMLMSGNNGYEVCSQLKTISHLKQVPVLLLGAKQPQEVYQQAKFCNATGYLYQPFHPEQLYKACEALLSGKTYFP